MTLPLFSVHSLSVEKIDQHEVLLPPSKREVARRSRAGGSVLSYEATLPQSRLASCQPPQGGGQGRFRASTVG